MGAILKLIIVLYLLSLIFSMFTALIRFFIDVAKWHIQEKKVKITKSNDRGENNGRNNNIRGTGDNDTSRAGDSDGDRTGDNDTSRTGDPDGTGEQRSAIVF